ncbi:MAG: DUF2383 domain-containing protein [Bacillota bacterium]|nr:DUF2383 domain-containing protein [Bacillota bacterium]
MESVANELNLLLRGIDMAVEAYEFYIGKVEDANLKSELQKIQKDHKNHASIVAERIQNLGHKPQYGTGVAGFFANTKNTLQKMADNEDTDILKQAYEGEDKGVAMAEELVKGDLDSESAVIARKVLSEDKEHLVRMKELMENNQIC